MLTSFENLQLEGSHGGDLLYNLQQSRSEEEKVPSSKSNCGFVKEAATEMGRKAWGHEHVERASES